MMNSCQGQDKDLRVAKLSLPKRDANIRKTMSVIDFSTRKIDKHGVSKSKMLVYHYDDYDSILFSDSPSHGCDDDDYYYDYCILILALA